MEKTTLKILYFLVLLIVCHYSLKGQDRSYFFENLREDAGLPYHLVNKIDEDSLGRLWLATYNGVYCYDGYEFVPFQHHSKDHKTISSDLCSDVLVDREQNVWVGTNGNGLCKIKAYSREVVRYDQKLMHNQFGQIGNKILHLAQDNYNGHIWVATSVGLFEFSDLDTISFACIQLADTAQFKSHRIECLYADHKKNLWIGTKDGLFCYNIEDKTWLTSPNSIQLLKGSVSSITESDSGLIWVGLKDKIGLYFLPDKEMKFSAYPLVANFENSNRVHLTFDKNGQLWVVGGKTGVFIHDLKTQETQFFPGKDYDQLTGNFSNYTNNPMVDRVGNVWFCGGGLHKYANTNKHFVHYTHPLSTYQSTSAIYDDKEIRITALWGRGLILWKKKKNRFLSFTEKEGLLSNSIYSIKSYSESQFLLAGEGGFQVIDTEKETLGKTIPIQGTIYDLKIRKGKIYLAGSKGFWVWDKEGGLTQILKTYDFRSFEWDQRGICWLATLSNGLISWDQLSEKVIFFQKKQNEEASIQGNRIEYLKINSQGLIWLATNAGLESYDPIRKVWRHFRIDSPSKGSRVNAFSLQNDSIVWLSTNSGISKLNTTTLNWTHFNVQDGILNPYFYERCIFQNQSGQLFWGGRKGVTLFDPQEVGKNEYPPQIYFSDIKIDNHSANNLDLKQAALNLNWQNDFFEINYKAVHLSNPKEISYRYRLFPVQKNWINTTQTQLFYSGLSSGRYTLEVLAKNSDDIWTPSPKKLDIFIQPPLWERWWFRILAGLVLISLLVLIIVWREKNIKNRVAIQTKIKELERAALRAQMSPHFVFNAMSGIQYFITSGKEESALRFLTKLSRLIRKVLEYADQSSIPLEEELQLLDNYVTLEQMRFAKTIDYQTHLDPNIYPEQIQLPPMLIQPILENAINHGLRPSDKPIKKLHLSINQPGEGQLKILIEDNGIGRNAAAKTKTALHGSKGTEIVRSRLKLAGEQMEVNTNFQIIDLYQHDGTPRGTAVELIVPFQLS